MLAPNYYPGSTVAGQSPQTRQAIDLLTQRAMSGGAATNAANQNIADTLNGKYLDPAANPGFKQALEDIKRTYSTGTAAQTDAAFSRAGAYGGSAYDETKESQNKAFADSMNTLAGKMFDSERMNQMRAAGLAPAAAAAEYTDIGQLANAGQSVDQYNQSLIDAAMQKYAYESNQPLTALQNYQNLISGNYGGTVTTNTPMKSNSFANTRLKEKLGERFSPYTFRHGFCQRLLVQGVDHLTVAALLGHADGQMVQRVYSHMDQEDGHLWKILRQEIG